MNAGVQTDIEQAGTVDRVVSELALGHIAFIDRRHGVAEPLGKNPGDPLGNDDHQHGEHRRDSHHAAAHGWPGRRQRFDAARHGNGRRNSVGRRLTGPVCGRPRFSWRDHVRGMSRRRRGGIHNRHCRRPHWRLCDSDPRRRDPLDGCRRLGFIDRQRVGCFAAHEGLQVRPDGGGCRVAMFDLKREQLADDRPERWRT